MTASAPDAWPGLSYAALEGAILALHDADPEAVRARFRKLRLRPFPDDIRSRRGVRVGYDLPRVIAILAVFEVNALHIPQGQAATIVEATWPEWCRASIAAACELGLMARPSAMPRWSSASLTILPDAFAEDPSVVAAYATEALADEEIGIGPALTFGAARVISAIQGAIPPGEVDEVKAAFEELERSHGWTRSVFPTRSELARIARGRGFLEGGPYLPRARMLLDATLGEDGHARLPQRERLQALLEYLEQPVPVDAWKEVVGTEAGEPRLGQLLQAFAVTVGLKPRKPLPETMLASIGADAGDLRARAAALIEAIG